MFDKILKFLVHNLFPSLFENLFNARRFATGTPFIFIMKEKRRFLNEKLFLLFRRLNNP